MAFCSSRFCSSRIPPRIRASESAILPFVCLRRENEGIQASPRIKFKSSGTLPLTLRAKRAVDLSTRFLLLRSVSFADSSSFFFFFFQPRPFFFLNASGRPHRLDLGDREAGRLLPLLEERDGEFFVLFFEVDEKEK